MTRHFSLAKLNPRLLQNLSAVTLHKVVQVVGLAVTVALVPRLFGAEDYGRFAFVLSLSYLGQILGDFGTLDVMGKFVPGLSHSKAACLYMRHVAFKLFVGLLCGLITAAAALSLADWMRPAWAAMIGLGVMLHILAWVPYQFSLGLNRVGTWMSEQAWRQWALLVLLLLLLPPLGLGGAIVALLLMELLFCLLGSWLVRDYWQAKALRLNWDYLKPYLRFGLGFFAANLAAVALYRSGPLLVEIQSGNSSQTGFFNLALGLFLLAYITTGQFAQSLLPNLSQFYSEQQSETMRAWLNSFVLSGWLLGWAGVVFLWVVAGRLVPIVFGAEFAPAAAALQWISLGIPPAVLLWAANVTATVTGRGLLKFTASLLALVIFVGVAWLSTPLLGAVGASMALVTAVVVNALALTLPLRADFKPRWALLLAISLVGSVGLALISWVGG